MVKRFEYRKMEVEEFLDRIGRLEINIKTFSRLTGVGLRTVERWTEINASKRQDIPPWVHLMLAYMDEPGSMSLARDIAADIIKKDNMFPDRGEYPFADEEYDDEN